MGRLRKGEEPDRHPSRLSWPSSLASDASVMVPGFSRAGSLQLNREGVGRLGPRANL